MNVDQLYQLAQYIINKNQSGYLSPDQFNLLIGQAQTSFLDYLLGEFQQYQVMRAQPRIQYSQNETIRQRLTPFIYLYNLHIDVNGFSPYPGDYQETDAMWSMYNFHRYRYVRQDFLNSHYNSKIDPYQKMPIFLIEPNGFQFYPQNLGTAKLSYVQTPPPIYWAYTLDGNNRPVYDPVNSSQPLWFETDLLSILVRMIRITGVNLQAADVSQYAEEIKNNGQ